MEAAVRAWKRGTPRRSRSMSWSRRVGIVFVVLGTVGFVTVADDLRHVGEVLAVGSVLFIGLVLLAAGSKTVLSRRLALPWLATAVGVGTVAGAAMDNMWVGVGGGLAIGAILAAVLGRRRERAPG